MIGWVRTFIMLRSSRSIHFTFRASLSLYGNCAEMIRVSALVYQSQSRRDSQNEGLLPQSRWYENCFGFHCPIKDM
jgi:hypothetical protein